MNSEFLILSVETATLGGSVCLSKGAEILATFTGDSRVSHSNTLLSDIDKLLQQSRVRLKDIELFAAAVGPGSFTGLRIGIATVKALATTLNRQCAGVPTLHAIAHAAGASPATVALLPAGRGELFAQLLSVSRDLVVNELDTAMHLPPAKVRERYGHLEDICWAGQGAQLYLEIIKSWADETGHPMGSSAEQSGGWRMVESSSHLAENVAALAFAQFESEQLDTPSSLQALYVRPSDAELNQSSSNAGSK